LAVARLKAGCPHPAGLGMRRVGARGLHWKLAVVVPIEKPVAASGGRH
jgi:hypothetical protein